MPLTFSPSMREPTPSSASFNLDQSNMNPFCGKPKDLPQHRVDIRFLSCCHLHSFRYSSLESLSFLARLSVGAVSWSPFTGQQLCQPISPNSQTIQQVDLHWLPPYSRQRQCCQGIHRANQESNLTVEVVQTMQTLYEAADHVLSLL